MKSILVGVDGSPDSLDAVVWTAQLARGLGAEVIAAAAFGFYPVVAMPSEGFPVSEDWLEGWRTELRRDLDGDWTRPLRDAGVSFTTKVEEGHASDVLLRLARDNGVDLIVVGSRGLGVVKEMLLGSVSHILALRAPCPVVVLPHRQREHHAHPSMSTTAPVATSGAH